MSDYADCSLLNSVVLSVELHPSRLEQENIISGIASANVSICATCELTTLFHLPELFAQVKC